MIEWMVLGALATYYTALVIAEQDGPFGIFAWARSAIPSKGLRCVVCVSVYAGLFWALFLALFGLYDAWLFPVVGFGLAGASVFVNKVWKR